MIFSSSSSFKMCNGHKIHYTGSRQSTLIANLKNEIDSVWISRKCIREGRTEMLTIYQLLTYWHFEQ